MKEPSWETCNEKELWEYVASHLSKNGMSSILVGGAVVAIYSKGAYRSGDLDFVLESLRAKELPKLMDQIGFKVHSGRHYKHPKCKHMFVEFCSPPAGIGEDTRITPDEINHDGTIIKIYSPTDCIRDRLASVIHFRAKECLDQAVLVAKNQPHNLKKIESWCKTEGGSDVFQEFLSKLKSPSP